MNYFDNDAATKATGTTVVIMPETATSLSVRNRPLSPYLQGVMPKSRGSVHKRVDLNAMRIFEVGVSPALPAILSHCPSPISLVGE